jgi:hypothetical protein
MNRLGYVAWMQLRNFYKLLIRKPEEKSHFGRPEQGMGGWWWLKKWGGSV